MKIVKRHGGGIGNKSRELSALGFDENVCFLDCKHQLGILIKMPQLSLVAIIDKA